MTNPPASVDVTSTLSPGQESAVWAEIDRFDEWFDRLIDPLRGHAAVDRLFYTAAELGDWSLIWHIFATAQAVRSPRLESSAVRTIVALGAESLLVNGGVKRIFNRRRPVPDFERPLHLRIPRTSSFPSGHASSATMAAILLSEKDPAMRPIYAITAALIAFSRPYVRIHHASDVIGGVAVGWALATIVKRLWPV